MKRLLYSALAGTVIALVAIFLDLPFQGAFYRLLARTRGPIPPKAPITLVYFDERDASPSWHDQLNQLMDALTEISPRVVALDFPIEPIDRRRVRLDSYPFPLVWQLYRARSYAVENQTALVSAPDFLDPLTGLGKPDPSMNFLLNTEILKNLVTETPAASKSAGILNIAGPPGTYDRVDVMKILENSEMRSTLRDRIILIAGPRERVFPRYGRFPFYAQSDIRGIDDTELHANAIDNMLSNTSIQPAGLVSTSTLTWAVALVSAWILIFFPPLLGILSVVLLGAVVLLLSIFMFSRGVYLSLQEPLVAIALVYYFLMPYRLIVEYKQKWKFQEQHRLLAEVETLKSNFMSLVSHNLKTPIARIEGIVESVLHRKNADPKVLQEDAKRILRSTDDLNQFVTKILSLTHAEDPHFQVRTSNRDVNTLIESVVDKYRGLAQEKNISLTTQLEPLFPVPLDAEMISESIANLVENAIKYTPDGGRVIVESKEDGDWIHISVSDTGPGIAPDEREKVFTKFFRGAAVKNKGIRGSGLGLYLVRYFVELHGGTISAENRTEGGSQFTMSLRRK